MPDQPSPAPAERSITSRQLEILQHALGVDRYGQGQMCRNHFCAGGEDVADCAELVAIGFMRHFERKWLPHFNCYVTDAGKRAVMKQSPRPPKLTQSQKRYREYLNWADAWSGTFREFLTAKGYASGREVSNG